jgi:hypothetical protein
MKNKYLMAVLLFLKICSTNLHSQILYTTQPPTEYYQTLKQKAVSSVPTENDLMNAKTANIPNNFRDTLLKYDWYEIGSYYFFDKEYKSAFSDNLDQREKDYANNQFDFIRYDSSGIEYRSSLHRFNDGSLKSYHTMFDESTASRLTQVEKQGIKNVIIKEIFGEKETIEIISYTNGILILNVKQAPNATTKRFHIAYLAMDKSF